MGKAVYSADDIPSTIKRLRGEAQDVDLQPHHIAAELLDDCRKKNDQEGVKFWRAVWIEIMSDDYLRLEHKENKTPYRSQLPGEGG